MVGCCALSGALTACASTGGGQIGEEGAKCQAVQSTALALSDISPLGFSAEQVLASVGGLPVASLTWADGSATDLTTVLTMAPTAKAVFQKREWVNVSDGGSQSSANTPDPSDCPDVVDLPMQLSFSTDDGAFDDQWEVHLLATKADVAELSVPLTVLSGTLDLKDFAPSNTTGQLRATLEMQIQSKSPTGVIFGQATNDNGTTASVEKFDIATIDSK